METKTTMARNQFAIENAHHTALTIEDIARWFSTHDYEMLDFEEGVFEFVTTTGGTPIYHKLIENKGYKTFAKEAFGGSLLVFEINVKAHTIAVECYAPMLLFGLIKKELTFKEKASWITKYRKDGYKTMMSLKDFINNAIKQET